MLKKCWKCSKKPGKNQNNDNENNNNTENVECNCTDDNDKNDISNNEHNNNDNDSMNNIENNSDNNDMVVAFNINDVDFFGQTALHLAAKNGHFEIMQLLINAGIDIHRKNSIFNMLFFNNISFVFIFKILQYLFIKLLLNAYQRNLKKKRKNFLKTQDSTYLSEHLTIIKKYIFYFIM